MLYEIPYLVSYTKIVVEKIKNQKLKIKKSKLKNQKKIFALFNQTVHRRISFVEFLQTVLHNFILISLFFSLRFTEIRKSKSKHIKR